MSDSAVPATTNIQPTVDPASSVPAGVTSVPVDQPASTTTDSNMARTASDGGDGTSTPTKKKSGFGGFIADLKKALPKSNKQQGQGQGQQQQGQGQAVMSDTPTPTGTAHPGTIIPDQSHTRGAQPVVPQDPTHPAHRGLLTGVDALISKEAEKIMNSMANMVENSGSNQATGDIPCKLGRRD